MQKNFLTPETKCEFLISEKRKKIWKIQIELIQALDSICKKYHLRYFASNGTLLGVIRHRGFVPWDDDVDIVMPRPDYQKLIEVAERELAAPLLLHTPMNDPVYYRNYIRLRNCNTTAIPLKDLNRRSRNGIFIDIFPIDGCPENIFIRKWQFFSTAIYSAMANTYIYYPNFEKYRWMRKAAYCVANIYCKVFSYPGLIRRLETIRSRTEYDDAQIVYIITHGARYMVFPRLYFENVEWMDFEYIKLPVPNAYDEILKCHYGNYMELPPMEERGKHHSIFFDPDKPYTEYVGVMTKEDAKKVLNDY